MLIFTNVSIKYRVHNVTTLLHQKQQVNEINYKENKNIAHFEAGNKNLKYEIEM